MSCCPLVRAEKVEVELGTWVYVRTREGARVNVRGETGLKIIAGTEAETHAGVKLTRNKSKTR